MRPCNTPGTTPRDVNTCPVPTTFTCWSRTANWCAGNTSTNLRSLKLANGFRVFARVSTAISTLTHYLPTLHLMPGHSLNIIDVTSPCTALLGSVPAIPGSDVPLQGCQMTLPCGIHAERKHAGSPSKSARLARYLRLLKESRPFLPSKAAIQGASAFTPLNKFGLSSTATCSWTRMV